MSSSIIGTANWVLVCAAGSRYTADNLGEVNKTQVKIYVICIFMFKIPCPALHILVLHQSNSFSVFCCLNSNLNTSSKHPCMYIHPSIKSLYLVSHESQHKLHVLSKFICSKSESVHLPTHNYVNWLIMTLSRSTN